MTKSMSRCR